MKAESFTRRVRTGVTCRSANSVGSPEILRSSSVSVTSEVVIGFSSLLLATTSTRSVFYYRASRALRLPATTETNAQTIGRTMACYDALGRTGGKETEEVDTGTRLTF